MTWFSMKMCKSFESISSSKSFSFCSDVVCDFKSCEFKWYLNGIVMWPFSCIIPQSQRVSRVFEMIHAKEKRTVCVDHLGFNCGNPTSYLKCSYMLVKVSKKQYNLFILSIKPNRSVLHLVLFDRFVKMNLDLEYFKWNSFSDALCFIKFRSI